MKLQTIANIILITALIGGILLILVNFSRFKKQPTPRRHPYRLGISVSIPALLLLIPLLYTALPTSITISDSALTMTGCYGTDIPLREISSMSIQDTLPAIYQRVNGVSFAHIRKGWYQLNGLGRCRLLINSENGPYLLIKTLNGESTIVNSNNSLSIPDTYHKWLLMTKEK